MAQKITRIKCDDLLAFPGELRAEIEDLRACGYLQVAEVEIVAPFIWLRQDDARLHPHHASRSLIVEVTEDCNIRCSYCCYTGQGFVRGRSGRKISREVISEGLQWFFRDTDCAEPRIVSFYGGEPLLCLEEIVYAVELASHLAKPSAPVRYGMTTNGTLLTPDVAALLFDHGFTIGVSLDGNAEVHNARRQDSAGQGTFDKVVQNLRELVEQFGKQAYDHVIIDATIDPKTYGHDMIAWLRLTDEMPFLAPFMKKFTTILSAEGSRFRSRLVADDAVCEREFVRHYIQDAANGGSDQNGVFRWVFDEPMWKIHSRERIRLSARSCIRGSCLPGLSRVFLSCDGAFYACEKVEQRIGLGSIGTGFDWSLVNEWARQWSELVEARCSGCWALRFCEQCLAALHGRPDREAAFHSSCIGQQIKLANNMAIYCAVLERNPRAFDRQVNDSGMV